MPIQDARNAKTAFTSTESDQHFVHRELYCVQVRLLEPVVCDSMWCLVLLRQVWSFATCTSSCESGDLYLIVSCYVTCVLPRIARVAFGWGLLRVTHRIALTRRHETASCSKFCWPKRRVCVNSGPSCMNA